MGYGSPLTVHNEGFAILRYPDGSPANYEAQLRVDDPSRTISGRVAVNRPLALRGVRLYLTGYQPADGGATVTLLAVHDPGYGWVIAGGLLLLLGVTVAVGFPHCSLHARIAADGTLRLAGSQTAARSVSGTSLPGCPRSCTRSASPDHERCSCWPPSC